MNIDTIRDTLLQAVAGNAALNAWCATNYGAGTTVTVIGLYDLERPPGEDDCPMVGIFVDTAASGEDRGLQEIVFGVFIEVHDTGSRTHAGYTNISDAAGNQNLLDMRELVMAALAAADIGNARLSVVDDDFGPPEDYPFFNVMTSVRVSETVCIGSQPILGAG